MSPHSTSWSRAVLALACAVTLPQAAWAQTPVEVEGYQEVPLATFLDEAKLEQEVGLNAKVSLSYLKFIRLNPGNSNEIEVLDEGFAGRLRATPRVASALTSEKDSAGRALPRREGRNVQLLGLLRQVARPNGPQVIKLFVDRVQTLEPDRPRFVRQGQAAIEAGDPQRLLQLASDCGRAARYAETLERAEEAEALDELAGTLRQRGRELVLNSLDETPLPEGAARWLEVGEQLSDLGTLAAVWEHPQVGAGLRAQADELLRGKLKARRYLGRWLDYREFKSKVGMAPGSRGNYYPVEELKLVQALRERRHDNKAGNPITSLTRPALTKAATDGSIIAGQDKRLVVAALAARARQASAEHEVAQLPVRVDRRKERINDTVETWELWSMPDGSELYFYRSILFKVVNPDPDTGGKQ